MSTLAMPIYRWLLAIVAVTGIAPAIYAASAGANVALHRGYTLQPAPNYSGKTSRAGATELTDGVLGSSATLWSQASTVGWSNQRPVTITIDLGSEHVLSDVTWHTAAGSSDVSWPAGLYALGSVDGTHFAELGDLVVASQDASGALPHSGYAAYTFRATVPPIPVRYLRILADCVGQYLFVDEIEAHEAARATSTSASYPITDMREYFWKAHTAGRAIATLRADFEKVRGRLVATSGASSGKLAAAATAFADAERDVRTNLPGEAKLPLSSAHARLLSLVATTESSATSSALTAWPASPWEWLDPTSTPPPSRLARVELVVMQGETRAAAINVRNSTATAAQAELSVRVDGIDAGQVTLAPVQWTATEASKWVASKIGPPSKTLAIPSGVTSQVWIRLSSARTAPGLHQGQVTITSAAGGSLSVPIAIRVFATPFPSKPPMNLSGWDYTSADSNYGITPANIDAVTQYLQSRGVTIPWATAAVLGFGTIDGSGKLTANPSTSSMERWLARWPSAVRYRVYVGTPASIGGLRTDSPGFPSAIKSWLTFWSAAIGKLGHKMSEFELLLADEPHSAEQAAASELWGRAIKASGIPVRIWIDPRWKQPSEIPAEVLANVDTVCVHHETVEASPAYLDWARDLSKRGPKDIEIYGTGGPAMELDPYAYYRAMAWRAFSIGADGESFWSFSDSGSADSSNGFSARSMQYTPYFLDSQSVAPGKQMEAIAEGVQDYAYLAMLAQVSQHGASADLRRRAGELLDSAIKAMLASAANPDGSWSTPRDHSVADAMRVKIGFLLDEAAPPQRK